MLALQCYINILCKYKIYFKNTDNNTLKAVYEKKEDIPGESYYENY